MTHTPRRDSRLMMVDGLGKAMLQGGRYAAAQQARHLRRIGLGNLAARAYLARAKHCYADAGARGGWTVGQERHNRLVPLR